MLWRAKFALLEFNLETKFIIQHNTLYNCHCVFSSGHISVVLLILDLTSLALEDLGLEG